LDPIHIIIGVITALALIGLITCLLKFYWATVAITAVIAAYIASSEPFNAQTIPYWAVTVLLIGVALVIATFLRSRQVKQRPAQKIDKTGHSGRRIVIDGTNVMYWDGETAQLDTLRSVVDYMVQRDIAPIVFLDASSRHHLKDKSLTEKGFARALGLPQKQVMVCPAGTEADVFILKYAKQESLQILSNDRFGDRSKLSKGIKIVKGVITAGRPILDGL
jgi:hypothetical protein